MFKRLAPATSPEDPTKASRPRAKKLALYEPPPQQPQFKSAGTNEKSKPLPQAGPEKRVTNSVISSDEYTTVYPVTGFRDCQDTYALRKVDLMINTRHKVVLCRCHCVGGFGKIIPESGEHGRQYRSKLQQHFSRAHKLEIKEAFWELALAPFETNDQKLRDLASLRSDFEERNDYPPIDGIEVTRGWKCKDQCGACGTVGTHEHETVDASLQKWAVRDNCPFVKVRERDPESPTSPDPWSTHLERLIKERDGADIEDSSQTQTRMAEFYEEVGWSQVLQTDNHLALVDLIDCPPKQDSPLWRNVEEYFAGANGAIRDANLGYRTIVKSNRVGKESILDRQENPEKYATALYRFIVFLLRSSATESNYRRLYKDNQLKVIDEFRLLLEDGDPTKLSMAHVKDLKGDEALTELSGTPLHGVLAACLLYRVEGQYHDTDLPVVLFACCHSLKSDERSGKIEHRNLQYLSSLLAAMKCVIRYVALCAMERAIHAGMQNTEARDFYKVFVRDGEDTPFYSVCVALRIVKMAVQQESSPGKILWQDRDCHALSFDGDIISLGDITMTIQKAIENVISTMRQDLHLPDELRIEAVESVLRQHPHSCVRDVGMNKRANFTFHRGVKIYRDRLTSDLLRRPEFRNDLTQSLFNRATAVEWLKIQHKVGVDLGCLMLITQGQPARATEMVSLLHANSSGRLRSLFLERGLLTTYLPNSKSHKLFDDLIPRTVAKDVSDLVIAYLTLIRPTTELIAHDFNLPGKTLLATEFFASAFSSKSMSGSEFCVEIQAFFKKYGPRESGIQDIGIRIYRQVIIAFSLEHLGRIEDFTVPSGSVLLHGQAGHTTSIAATHYARTEDLHRQTTVEKRKAQRDFSYEYQRMLSLRLPTTTKASPELYRTVGNPAREQITFYRNIHDGLKTLVGSPTFKSEQQEVAFHRVLERRDDVVVVTPTGSGKSILYQLPTFMEPELTTVVVLPLRALKAQAYNGYTRIEKIYTVVWNSGEPEPRPRPHLVLVSPENTTDDRLIKYLRTLSRQGHLARLCFDEAHSFLSHRSFRDCMITASNIRSAIGAESHVPIVLLSATIPPSQQSELFQALGIKRNVSVIRTGTQRPNIAYSVQVYPHHGEVLRAITEFVHNNPLRGLEKGIIFTPVYHLADELFDELSRVPGCVVDKYTGAMNDEQREESDRHWRSSAGKWMIGTSALAMGIDVKEVPLVLHVYGTYSILDYSQETGRAGRDGCPARAITFTTAEFPARYFNSAAPLELAKELHDLILDPSHCIRQALHSFLDGRSQTCLEGEDMQLCKVCRGVKIGRPAQDAETQADSFPEPMSSASTLPLRSARESSPELMSSTSTLPLRSANETDGSYRSFPLFTSPPEGWQVVPAATSFLQPRPTGIVPTLSDVERRRLFTAASGCCLFCFHTLGEKVTAHNSIWDCRYMGKKCRRCYVEGHGAATCPTKSVQAKKGSACYGCLVQSSALPHPSGQSYGRNCPFRIKDAVLPFIGCLYLDNDWRAAMEERFRPLRQWCSTVDFFTWALDLRRKEPGDQAMNVQDVLEWYFSVHLGM